jgi:hypothetical protein
LFSILCTFAPSFSHVLCLLSIVHPLRFF